MRDDRLRDDPAVQRLARSRPSVSPEDLSPNGARATAILERVLAVDVHTRRVRSRRSPWVVLGLGVPLASAAAAVLLIAGVFSGPAGSGTQPALAAVIRGVAAATAAKPGTILVQVTRGYSSSRIPGQPNPDVSETVLETPAGHGAQNERFSQLSGVLRSEALINGHWETYDHTTNTIYVASIWGPFITKARTPGSFVYKRPKYPGATYAETVVAGNLPPQPLTLTAAQAHSLQDGADEIEETASGRSFVTAVPRLTLAGEFRSLVTSHHFKIGAGAAINVKLVGVMTIGGRREIELSERRTGGIVVRYWVDAKTYAPIKETEDAPGSRATVTWLEYKTLPITPANVRLLSVAAEYPHARIDRSYKDFINANYNNWPPLPQ
ncbi:MAG TPA: hypothetical protein VME01_09675 [Solirubrobacteraceae bacterium]|nr:hypothetical protein [Solirubrobacteraceae bacterium]